MRPPILALLLIGVLASCSAVASTEVDPARADEILDLRARVGSVFQVEHFTAEVSARVKQDVQDQPPGSILFWNSSRADAAALREVIREYSQAALDAGSPPILFSTDYEGGALRRSHTWKTISGIQRFTKGFTQLAHARWLGLAYNQDPALGRELAFLHGKIMSRELRSVGINYPLSVVSDLAFGLFSVRGIDRDPSVVAEIMKKVLEGAMLEPEMVFVTKHFPGLGQTSGDTHDNIVVSPVMTFEEAETHLQPFREVVDYMKDQGLGERLSVLCSHAKFPFFDPDRNTTTSPVMLQSVLRDELGFDGIALSDAMWMGPYGSLGATPLHRIYLESFLAGMDMLMIPGGKYRGSRQYFEQVFDQTLSESEKRMWEERLDTDWEALHQLFLERLEDSVDRIDATTREVGYVHQVLDPPGALPTEATGSDRERYQEILVEVDGRWADEF